MMIYQGTVSLNFPSISRLTKLESHLVGDTITLYVGPKSKHYVVHKGLLTQHEWFSERIHPSTTSSPTYLNLLEEDPKVFELLISWLYRKKLNAISTIDEKVAEEEVTLYVGLYLRACEWDMHELQNALIDRMRIRTTCRLGFFPQELIKKIYENTQSLSPLRSYIVDSFIYKGIQWEEGGVIRIASDGNHILTRKLLTRKRALKHQWDAGNQDFVLDCCEAMFQLCAKSKVRDPDRRTGCVYHTHKEGGKCQR